MDHTAGKIVHELDFSGLQVAASPNEMERRSYARLKIPLRVDVGMGRDVPFIQTEIFDISEGGLCLISNFEVEKGNELSLRIWFDEHQSIAMAGVVKYCVKKAHENREVYFHGIEFIRLSEEISNNILQFLKAKRSELAAIEISLDEIVKNDTNPLS